jgi:putative tryptophan/tyrosine transport system substrate-binding protein
MQSSASEAMRRREFIRLIGVATVAWPFAVRAQQQTVPLVGFLDLRSPDAPMDLLQAFRQGLKDTGYNDGENITIEYRWASNQPDQLPELAADLVRRKVAVIAAGNTLAAFAAKAATTTIPIVFTVPENPVTLGLVTNLARPDGNMTGINWLAGELTAKRLELLRELVPGAARIALLVDPKNGRITEATVRDIEAAARSKGLQIPVLEANTSGEIDAAFATFARERPDALFVGSSPLFNARRIQLVHLASYHRVPTTYSGRVYVEAGGLMSYGASVTDALRQMGVYTGRILKGTKPTDLPVLQSTKLELVINRQTARMLGLTVPPSLLAIADEVIE